MARLRNAPQQPAGPATTSTAPRPSRQALKEKTNTIRRRAPVYEDDGNTEDLVKDARPRRGRRKASTQQEDGLVMAGGLGRAGSDSKTSERSAPPPTTDELVKSDGPPPPTAKTNRRPPRTIRKVIGSAAQDAVLDGVKERMKATMRGHGAAKTQRGNVSKLNTHVEPSSDSLPANPLQSRKSSGGANERSEYSLSPSPPPPGKLHSVVKQRPSLGQPGPALPPQGTPAVEASILALKNFKRRPRQPSMLQMVQQRNASARPSVINNARVEDPSIFDVDDEEEDDFTPDAEGTPLHLRKKTVETAARPKRSSTQHQSPCAHPNQAVKVRASTKRKSGDADLSSSSVTALKAKRVKATSASIHEDEVQTGANEQEILVESTPSERFTSPPPQLTSDLHTVHSSPSSTPPTEHSSPDCLNRRRSEPEADIAIPSTEPELVNVGSDAVQEQDTMADPASSSPPPELPSLTQRTDVMADPLTQLSPPRPKRDKPPKEKKKKSQLMSTATLQSLLPKRRQHNQARHRKSEYDIDSASEDDAPLDTSHLDQGEDELSGKLRRKTTSKPQPSGKKGKGSAMRPKARQSKAAVSVPRKSTALKRSANTYGRAAAVTTASDKENDDNAAFDDLDDKDDSALPDTSMSMHEAAHSKELERAKKKFAAVDEWDMEFESMSNEEHRSSSQGWR